MSEQVFHIGVKALIRNSRGEFLVLVRHNPVKITDKENTNWDIPGGRMNIDEDFEATLAREIGEETGATYSVKPKFFTATLTKIKIPTDRGEVALVLMIYSLTLPDDTKLLLSQEHTGFEWVDLETAIERLSSRYSADFPAKMRQYFA